MDTQAAAWLQHLRSRVGAITVRSDPFPHFYLTDFLPADMYASLVGAWPRPEAFVTTTVSGLVAPKTAAQRYPTDLRLLVTMKMAIGSGAPESRTFWQTFARLLLGPDIVHALAVKLIRQARAERSDLPNELDLWADALVQDDIDGFMLGPHLDSVRKLASMVFYAPVDDARPDLGTSLFSPTAEFHALRPELGRQFDGNYYRFEDFDCTATMACVPNALFGFVVSPRAFHGVKPIHFPGGHRRNILWNIFWNTGR
jgi:hypothetical protein